MTAVIRYAILLLSARWPLLLLLRSTWFEILPVLSKMAHYLMFNKLSNCRLAANHQRKTNEKRAESESTLQGNDSSLRTLEKKCTKLQLQFVYAVVGGRVTPHNLWYDAKLGTSSSNLSMRLPLMEPLSWVHPIDWFMKEKLQNLIFGWSDGMHVFGSFWSPCIVCCKLNLAAMI